MNQDERLQRAVAAATTVARQQGLQFERAIALQNQSNIILHLYPSAIVARVMGSTSTVRQGDAWFVREVAIAQHLTAHQAPIIPPSSLLEAGPHYHDGLIRDLASLVAVPQIFGTDQDKAEAALQGYGSYDPEALDLCIEARTLIALVWTIILYREHPNPERLPRIERRLQWLRDRYQKGDRP